MEQEIEVWFSMSGLGYMRVKVSALVFGNYAVHPCLNKAGIPDRSLGYTLTYVGAGGTENGYSCNGMALLLHCRNQKTAIEFAKRADVSQGNAIPTHSEFWLGIRSEYMRHIQGL